MTMLGVNQQKKDTVADLQLVEQMGQEALQPATTRIPISIRSDIILIPTDMYVEGLSGEEDMIRVDLTDKKVFEHYALGNDSRAKEHEELALRVAGIVTQQQTDARLWTLAKMDVLAQDIELSYLEAVERLPSQGLITLDQATLYGEASLQQLGKVLRSLDAHNNAHALALEETEATGERSRGYFRLMKKKHESRAWAEGKQPKASEYTLGRQIREFRKLQPYGVDMSNEANATARQRETPGAYNHTTGPRAYPQQGYVGPAPKTPTYNGPSRTDANAFATTREMSRITLDHTLGI